MRSAALVRGRERRERASRARFMPRSSTSPEPMPTSATSPDEAPPARLMASAIAAMPICQKRPTLEPTICSVMAATIPTTAALKPPSRVPASEAPPTFPYKAARITVAVKPGRMKAA